ncbi:MAG: leucine-rich repeat domain-containing protein [Tannerella sp.]|nr:leucine-rich repeat domain-containing protein [Tannerella sp.]
MSPPNYQANYQQNLTAVDRWGDLGHGSLRFAFYNCSSLRAVERKPKYLFEKMTSLAYAFMGCTSLSAVFESMDAPLLEDVSGFCWSCSSLEYIPDRLFSKCPSLKVINGAFQYCTSLIHVSVNLFTENTELTNASLVFAHCTNLRNGVTFYYNRKIQYFNRLYLNCTSLEIVPDYCFVNAVATAFEAVFAGCASLTSLPEHILAGAGNASSFWQFAERSGVQSLPAGLFADCPNAVNFIYAFARSALLAVELPVKAFFDMCYGLRFDLQDVRRIMATCLL